MSASSSAQLHRLIDVVSTVGAQFSRSRHNFGTGGAIAEGPTPVENEPNIDSRNSLLELALIFLRLGLTAFGGPAAHIAMMHREFVEARKWLSEAEFLDLLGAVNLIPGPNSTQVAIHIGRVRAGVKGLVIAGVCFILPAALLVSGFAWAYVRYGASPDARYLLYGIKPVIVAVVVQAIWSLAKATIKSIGLGAVGAIAATLAALNLAPLAIVFGCGACTALIRWLREKRRESLGPLAGMVALVGAFALIALLLGIRDFGRIPFAIGPLFLFFLKVGSVLYGSGYVLLAYLNNDLVTRWGWLTQGQLLDAVAVGQFTPGPVFTTATFIGFYLGGPVGAVVATVGIFLPSFVFVALSGRLLPKVRKSAVSGAFMDGVNAASLALMAVVAFQLGATALRDWLTVALAVVGALLLVRYRLNSAWLIGGGAVVGICAKIVGS